MKKAVTLGVAALLFAIAGFLLWLGHGAPETNGTAVISTPASTPAATASQPPINSAPAPEPAKGFEVDAGGHLKIAISARQVFDYFLGAGNGVPSGASTARTQGYIHAHLQEPAATEALALLEHYAAYRKAVGMWQTENTTAGNADLAAIATLQQQSTLKAQYLSPEVVQAFYGDEDAIAHYQLARKQIMQMNGISREQKNEQLATLRQQLPLSAQNALGNARDEDE